MGVNKFNVNPKEGLNYLVEEGLIEDNPESICEFLSTVSGLSKRRLGEYFGRVSGSHTERALTCGVVSGQQNTQKSANPPNSRLP